MVLQGPAALNLLSGLRLLGQNMLRLMLPQTNFGELSVFQFLCFQGFFLTVSPDSIVKIGKHAAEKDKASNLN